VDRSRATLAEAPPDQFTCERASSNWRSGRFNAEQNPWETLPPTACANWDVDTLSSLQGSLHRTRFVQAIKLLRLSQDCAPALNVAARRDRSGKNVAELFREQSSARKEVLTET
jgi:hypothetical protein